MNQNQEERSGLTALRGIAALFIVAIHMREFSGDRSLDAYTHAIAKSYLWVDLFFILSGIVIAKVYGAVFARACTASDYRDFLVKRLARIYPLHAAILAAFVVFECLKLFEPGVSAYKAFSVNTVEALFWNLMLTQSWGFLAGESWNVPAWSISVEWAAYLVFPLLLWVCRALVRRFGLAAALLPIAGVTALAVQLGDLNLLYSAASLPRCLLSFSLGIIIEVAMASRKDGWRGVLTSDVACLAAMVAVGLCLHLGVFDAVLIPCFGLLCLGVNGNTGNVQRVLDLGPLQYLGRISYSIYMDHWLLFLMWKKISLKRFPADPSLGLGFNHAIPVFAVVLCVATATYYLIERPARGFLRNRLLKRRPATDLPRIAPLAPQPTVSSGG